MNVKMFTPAQAGTIYKRFTPWFEIEPIPLKNGNWYIPVSVLVDLKNMILDSGILDRRPAVKDRIIALRDAIVALPTYDTDDYPQFLYDDSLPLDDPEQIERTQRYADFKATYEREDI